MNTKGTFYLPVFIILLAYISPVLAQIEEDIAFKSAGNSLHGILLHPDTSGPHPAMVLLHGSDRGGVDSYEEFAVELVKSGFTILRYDSPGVGKSTGDAFGETFDYRVQEAIAAVEYLQSRRDIKINAIGLWGISQGGWICQMTAATSDKVAFIIPVSGPGVNVPEQELYRVETNSRAAGLTDEEIKKAVLVRRLFVDALVSFPMYEEINKSEATDLGEGPWIQLIEMIYADPPVDPSVELTTILAVMEEIKDDEWATYLMISDLLPMFKSLTPESWIVVKAQFETIMTFDPADYLKKIQVPVLAIFGEADATVPVKRSIAIYRQSLNEAGNNKLTIKVFPNADHGININGKPAPGYYASMNVWLSALSL